MNIVLNGKTVTLEGIPTLDILLKAKGFENKMVAVARNGAFLPKEKYHITEITNGDIIEIVAPMQGG